MSMTSSPVRERSRCKWLWTSLRGATCLLYNSFDCSLLLVLVCRLVRVCLGPTSVSARKLAHGNPLTILGVDLCIKHDGVVFWPAEQKVANWIMRIQASMSDLSMSSGEASKLSGALQWASQASFRRVGRAMLRPLINHIHSRLPVFDASSELMLALRWWSEVLCLKIRYVPLVRFIHMFVLLFPREERSWYVDSRKQCHLFCDARSSPPRVAAVLFRSRVMFAFSRCCDKFRSFVTRDARISYTDMAVDEETMNFFRKRGDKQIMSLELLAIAIGVPVVVV